MTKRFILILTAVLLVGLVLIAVSSLFSKETAPASAENTVGEARTAENLGPFTAVDIQVKAADIRLVRGEDYTISYKLHSREPVKQLEVVDGTLILDTGFSAKWSGDFGDWYVTVTVPEDAQLDELDLYTTAGTISLEGFSFREGDFGTVAGTIDVLDCAAESVEAETTSGAVTVSGSYDEVEAKSVSGAVTVEGEIARSVEAETVSGGITVKAPLQTIDASNVSGGVFVDGHKQGRKFTLSAGAPEADIQSVSGKITLETK